MADKNRVQFHVALIKEDIYIIGKTEFDDDLSHLSGEQVWDSMVVPLVAHAKQEFIKDYEKTKE